MGVGAEPGTQRHSKWSENQICSLSPPPTSITTHLAPLCRLHSSHHPTYHPIVHPSGPVTGPPSSPPSLPVPRKLERAPPFDPADSHPPRPSTANLTPSPNGPQALELNHPSFPCHPFTVSLSLSISVYRLRSFRFPSSMNFPAVHPPIFFDFPGYGFLCANQERFPAVDN